MTTIHLLEPLGPCHKVVKGRSKEAELLELLQSHQKYSAVAIENCQRFGILEMKTIVSTILRSYRVESLDGRDVVLPVMQGFLKSNVPIRVRIRPRRSR
ncbi:hypothetical protein TNCV_460911 [Trichonephila clavipes]|nr:hypothetical protein TNCV_460911 [Trichonephila clavipes]